MLKIHFMYDNHTFARFGSWATKDDLVRRVTQLFEEDGFGSIFVRDALDGGLTGLTLHGGQLVQPGKWGVRPEDVDAWADKVLAENSFLKMVA